MRKAIQIYLLLLSAMIGHAGKCHASLSNITAHPCYNGNISAKVFTGGRYDYYYDSHNRLVKAAFSGGVAQSDFSTEYTYDPRANITSMTRKGVVDRVGGTEIFGTLDDISVSYSGNHIANIAASSDAIDFSGITGLARNREDLSVGYDRLGRISYDDSRDITSITYDHDGNPVRIETGSGESVTFSYDALGNKLSETHSGYSGTTLREYTGAGHIIENGVLKRTACPGGYFRGSGTEPYYSLTDYQGNNIGVITSGGIFTERVNYYPYGEPWREPQRDNYLYSANERLQFAGINDYDFHARRYSARLPMFDKQDRLNEKYPWLSPYAYCAGNPVMKIDPDGEEVSGESEEDAKLLVEDFRAMFPGEKFEKFRELIARSGKKQNGKSLAKIDSEAQKAALEGVKLNEDQQALVDMVVNTINSDKVQTVEYNTTYGVVSSSGKKAFLPGFQNGPYPELISSIMEQNNDNLPCWLIYKDGGGGATTMCKSGVYSVIFTDYNHLNGRAVTMGHEVLGHGRSLSLGRGDDNQHYDAIQTENLILRVMGISFVNTGEGHGNSTNSGFFDKHSTLPEYR